MGASKNTRLLPNSVNAVRLPARIKCCRCGTVKNPGAFSKNRLLDLKKEIHEIEIKGRTFNPALFGFVPCEDCTSKQKDEFQCCGCDKWKGKDAFSKQQRKKDDPLCWPCLHDQNNLEPFNGKSDDDDDYDDEDFHDESSDSNDFSSDDDEDGGVSTLAGNFTGLGVNSYWSRGHITSPSSNGGVPVGSSDSRRNVQENIQSEPQDYCVSCSTPSAAFVGRAKVTARESRFAKDAATAYKPGFQIESVREQQQQQEEEDEEAAQRAHDEIEVASSPDDDDEEEE